jgi:hypothetical protein
MPCWSKHALRVPQSPSPPRIPSTAVMQGTSQIRTDTCGKSRGILRSRADDEALTTHPFEWRGPGPKQAARREPRKLQPFPASPTQMRAAVPPEVRDKPLFSTLHCEYSPNLPRAKRSVLSQGVVLLHARGYTYPSASSSSSPPRCRIGSAAMRSWRK